MGGLVVLFCVLAVLAFFLVWIANVVAQTDVEIKTGMGILFLTGIIGAGTVLALHDSGRAAAQAGGAAAHFIALIVLLKLGAGIDWGKSAIIAVIFTVLLWLTSMAIASMFAA